jgi:hypothetical protein
MRRAAPHLPVGGRRRAMRLLHELASGAGALPCALHQTLKARSRARIPESSRRPSSARRGDPGALAPTSWSMWRDAADPGRQPRRRSERPRMGRSTHAVTSEAARSSRRMNASGRYPPLRVGCQRAPKLEGRFMGAAQRTWHSAGMPSSSDIRPHEGRPTPPIRSPVSDHRFTVPVVRPLPRPVVAAFIDPRVW